MYRTEVYRAIGDSRRAHQELCEGLEVVLSFENSALRAKYLLEAALLWYDEGKTKLVVLWIGLLSEHTYKLNAEQRERLSQLQEILMNILTPEAFASVFERGKRLDLNNTMQQIFDTLNETTF